MDLPGYDEWKTRAPDRDDGPTCEKCGGWLTREWDTSGWFCEPCEDEDDYWQSLIDRKGQLVDMEDMEFLADGA